MSPGDEERVLVDAILAGDERAWGVLLERHFAALHAFVHGRTRGRTPLAEDVVQECFLVAVRRLGDFDPVRGGFGSWLRGIALHLLRNQRRSEVLRRASETGGDLEAMAGPRAAGDPGRDLELAEEIALAMAELPPRYREVLRAKYEAGLSMDEIAGRRGETRKAVESLLSRAREAFRAAYRRLSKG